MLNRNGIIAAVVAFFIGFAIGLFLFGWTLTPVSWSDAGPQDLSTNYEGVNYQEFYLRNLAELHALKGVESEQMVRNGLRIWPDANVLICQMAAESVDPTDTAQLKQIASINSADGQGCDNPAALALLQEDAADEGGSNTLLLCLVAFLFFLIIGVIAMLIIRRNSASSTAYDSSGSSYQPYGAMETDEAGTLEATAPVTTAEEDDSTTQAIARFRTNYRRGDDMFDDSFPIENTAGDFLGECGVGISESIGTDSPKSVTAFEVWLFDKNDIRTITKVVMSDHAFFDDAIKAKLQPKGEPVLGRLNEVVVLETASLIINAEIVELEYGTSGSLPAESYFDNFAIELSAWTKESNG